MLSLLATCINPTWRITAIGRAPDIPRCSYISITSRQTGSVLGYISNLRSFQAAPPAEIRAANAAMERERDFSVYISWFPAIIFKGNWWYNSMGWFVRENLNRKPWFLPLNMGFPVNCPLNQSIPIHWIIAWPLEVKPLAAGNQPDLGLKIGDPHLQWGESCKSIIRQDFSTSSLYPSSILLKICQWDAWRFDFHWGAVTSRSHGCTSGTCVEGVAGRLVGISGIGSDSGCGAGSASGWHLYFQVSDCSRWSRCHWALGWTKPHQPKPKHQQILYMDFFEIEVNISMNSHHLQMTSNDLSNVQMTSCRVYGIITHFQTWLDVWMFGSLWAVSFCGLEVWTMISRQQERDDLQETSDFDFNKTMVSAFRCSKLNHLNQL